MNKTDMSDISLRDYFAAKAMQAQLPTITEYPDEHWRVGVALDAYEMADAMIIAKGIIKARQADAILAERDRAVPDVPELARYDLACDFDGKRYPYIIEVELGDYVHYDQVAAIISALKAELYDMQKERDRALEWRDHDRERAFTAEANNKRLREALETLVDRISYYASLAEEGTPNIEDWAYTDNSGDIAKARAALEGSKK